MRLILTGATGFIGRNVLRLACERGHEVHVLGRSQPDDTLATFHPCDLMDLTSYRSAIAKIDAEAMIHLAWYAEPGKFWDAVENLDWLAASLQLVRNFACGGGKRRLVTAGSCAEYGWNQAVLDEWTTPLDPSTLYGFAKSNLFRLIDRTAEDMELSFACGRIFFPYGPNDKPERLLGGLLRAAANRSPVHFTAGTQKRDFIHVADVAAALVALMESRVEGPVNIGTGEAVSVRALVEQAAALCNAQDLLHFGTHPLPSNEPVSLVARVDRLSNEVGYVPQFDLNTGLINTVTHSISCR